jgi:hypothetical protein
MLLIALLLAAPPHHSLPPGHLPFETPVARLPIIGGWEADYRDIPRPGHCTRVDIGAIFPVEPELRDEAIAMLSRASAIAIDDGEARRLGGANGPPLPNGPGGPSLLGGARPPGRPYLVRAVARRGDNPYFFGDFCTGDLHLENAVISPSIPPSLRLPVVVYLEAPLRRVYATTSILN